jgi:outer membrane protein assembly factor BamB
VDNGVVYCGSATGHVYAVDANSGVELWASALSSDTATNVYQPKVSNGVVYVGFTHFNPAALEIRGGVAALSQQTGRLLWEQILPHGDSLDKTAVFNGVFLTPSQVVAQASDDIMYGFDRQSGQLTTTIPITTFESATSGNPGSPEDLPSFASANGLFFTASPSLRSVTALSASDLHHLWTMAFPWGSPMNIVAAGDRLYAGAAGGQFGAFDLNGTLLWSVQRFDLRSDGQEDLSFAPAIDSTQLYLTGKHEVYAFKKQ